MYVCMYCMNDSSVLNVCTLSRMVEDSCWGIFEDQRKPF